MELVIGVKVDLTTGDHYQHEIEIALLLMWECFLKNLMASYDQSKEETVCIEVYVSQYKEGRCLFIEYIIPIVLIDFYGRLEFKSVLPKGCMVDLFEPTF